MKSNFNLPKVDTFKGNSSFQNHNERVGDMFFRGEHPDNRTAAQFFADMKINRVKKSLVNGKWYPRTPGRRGPAGTKIMCITTGEVFESIRIASCAYGIHSSNLSKHLQGHKMYSHVSGLTFRIL